MVEVMLERGVDLSGRRPQALTDELVAWAQVVITMGCGDACPVLPGKRHLDWALPDPAGCQPSEVRALRDEIERRVARLLVELDREETGRA